MPKPLKAAKAASSSKANPLEAIPQLEKACTESTYNPNSLIPLLALSRHADPEVVYKAVWALHRVFIRYIHDNRVGGIVDSSSRSRGGAEEENEDGVKGEGSVKGWVRDRLFDYVEVLGGLLRDTEDALRTTALPLLFSLLGPLSSSVSNDKPILHTPYFRLILRSLFSPLPSLRGAKPASAGSAEKWMINDNAQVDEDEGVLPQDIIDSIDEDFWAKYDDIRWAFFKESAYLLENEPSSIAFAENVLGQLLPLTNLPRTQEDLNTFFLPSMSDSPVTSSAPTKKSKTNKKKKANGEIDALPDWMATYETESEDEDDTPAGRKRQRTAQLSVHASIHSVPSHTTLYTSLWESVLGRLRLDDAQTRKVLVGLHGDKGILGHMRADRRVRVADWLGSLVDEGGAKAMLAMNGLFVLMTKYNLDYPDFYKRLYGLLDANVLHVKYRARFFRLLDTFLASPLLPAALIASFIKRLSRLALTAPPAGIIIVIPFIYNLFKRHPGCMVMIQRHEDTPEEDDPYRPIDPSPMTTGAISSSCWELAMLQNHYLPAISTLAKIFTEVFTKPEYNMEDFLDHGYDTLFATEANRKIKNAPAMSLALESGSDVLPFPSNLGNVEGDEVSRLWTF